MWYGLNVTDLHFPASLSLSEKNQSSNYTMLLVLLAPLPWVNNQQICSTGLMSSSQAIMLQ